MYHICPVRPYYFIVALNAHDQDTGSLPVCGRCQVSATAVARWRLFHIRISDRQINSQGLSHPHPTILALKLCPPENYQIQLRCCTLQPSYIHQGRVLQSSKDEQPGSQQDRGEQPVARKPIRARDQHCRRSVRSRDEHCRPQGGSAAAPVRVGTRGEKALMTSCKGGSTRSRSRLRMEDVGGRIEHVDVRRDGDWRGRSSATSHREHTLQLTSRNRTGSGPRFCPGARTLTLIN